MKGYPRWFSPYSKPLAPPKPVPTTQKSEEVYSGDFLDKNAIVSCVNDWSGDEYHWSFSVSDSDLYGPEVSISVYRLIEVDNPQYAEQDERYKKAYAEYREKLKEWKSLKAKYDAEQTARREKSDRAQLAKLKKLYPE